MNYLISRLLCSSLLLGLPLFPFGFQLPGSFFHMKNIEFRPLFLSLRKEKDGTDPVLLKRIDDWGCMRNCGACCKLGPVDSRPAMEEIYSKEDLELYRSLIGDDDWCKHFDKDKKICKIYDNRPEFCRIEKRKYLQLYQLDEEDFTVRKLILFHFKSV